MKRNRSARGIEKLTRTGRCMDRNVAGFARAVTALTLGYAVCMFNGIVEAQQSPTIPGPVPSSSGAIYDAVGIKSQPPNPDQQRGQQSSAKPESAPKATGEKRTQATVRTLAPEKVPPAVSGQKGPYEPYLS